MRFFDVLTQAHQAILLFIWVYLIFGLAWPGWRRSPSEGAPAAGVYWPSLIWIIVAVVTFVAWLRLML